MYGKVCYLIVALLLGSPAISAQSNVVTYHNDNARTGQYRSEILLSPTSLKQGPFGKRYFLPVDGVVYAQPLYLSRVKIPGKGFHNILFVATSHDSLYAFDADDESGSPALWQVSFLDAAQGVTTVSEADVNCSVIPELGISGTPVIDAEAGTIYVIVFTKETGSQYVYRLHAIDVTSGAEQPGSPVEIQPQGFVPLAHKQRTALLLSNGIVYSSWSGNCDLGTYHGWVMAHDASTLALDGFFNSSPGDSGASFWNGGAGPVADEQGDLYVVSANGDFDGNAAAARYDESVLRLTTPGLMPADQFTPFNKLLLDEDDLDLGSSGALVLPDEAGSAAHPHLLFTSGKEGRIYLLDRQALGGVQTGTDVGALASLPVLMSHATFGTAAYFGGSIYIAPVNSPMLAFPVSGASLGSSPSASSLNESGDHGATPSISSNGSANGIVWTITADDGGRLLASDAGDLTGLYDSNLLPSDHLPGYAEFSVPTIADGKVFAGGSAEVAVYGESVPDLPAIAAVTNAGSYSEDAISPGSLISIFGSDLAGTTASALAVPLPMSVADTSVTVNGVPAPLLFESPGQINAQVPWEIAAGPATVIVRTRGALSPPVNITVQSAAPGLFTDQNGYAAALNADGSVNSTGNPAAAGSIISVFFTGQGPVTSAVDDGAAPPTGETDSATSAMSATIGASQAQIQFAGLAPLYPGVAQMNLKVPSLASGIYPLTIVIGGTGSNSAQLVISGLE
jgi:uncharacterized protein (TIGR03437 family)